MMEMRNSESIKKLRIQSFLSIVSNYTSDYYDSVCNTDIFFR